MPLSRVLIAAVAAAATLGLSGCGATLPTYEWSGHDAAMTQIVERSQAVRTVSGSCRIVLRDSGGSETVLDGALAARNPGYLRLRAWKFNQAVFDLTLTPEGLWTMIGRDAESDVAAKLTPAEIGRAWQLLAGEFFRKAIEMSSSSRGHVVEGRGANGAMVRCVIDRRTLVPERFDSMDDAGVIRASLLLDRYRAIGEHVWPMRMTFQSDAGSVIIQMRDIEINQDVPAGAFTPPSRATRQP